MRNSPMPTKIQFCIILLFLTFSTNAQKKQKKKVVILDTIGNVTDMYGVLSIMNTGKFKRAIDDSNETIRYYGWEKNTKREFDSLVARTKDRILLKNRIGEEFLFPAVKDIDGKLYNAETLRDKIVVINYWFVGCAPCEVEMPELNSLVEKYKDNSAIVFVSFSRSNEEKSRKFLLQKEFNYPVVVMEKGLSENFRISVYPTNYVIDSDGNYQYASQGIGAGSIYILEQNILEALKRRENE